jgi:hypothetical protein
MKMTSAFLIGLALSAGVVLAQPPQGFNYQALVRNSSGQALANQAVSVRVRLHRDSIAGTVVYAETHGVTTSARGNINLIIGRGTVVSGTFASLDWSRPMFLETGVDVSGGTSYTDLGTTQLMSVPYALYAGQAAPATLGQSSTNYYGTGTVFVSATDTVYKAIGLSQTINVPAGMTTLLQTTGTIYGTSFSAYARVTFGLFIDGALVSPGGECAVRIVTDDNISSGGATWAINYPVVLAAGNHTVEVRARGGAQNQTGTTIDNSGSSGRSVLTVTFLKN